MHSWKKKLVVSQLALACTLAITSQANASTDISGTTYTTFNHYNDATYADGVYYDGYVGWNNYATDSVYNGDIYPVINNATVNGVISTYYLDDGLSTNTNSNSLTIKNSTIHGMITSECMTTDCVGRDATGYVYDRLALTVDNSTIDDNYEHYTYNGTYTDGTADTHVVDVYNLGTAITLDQEVDLVIKNNSHVAGITLTQGYEWEDIDDNTVSTGVNSAEVFNNTVTVTDSTVTSGSWSDEGTSGWFGNTNNASDYSDSYTADDVAIAAIAHPNADNAMQTTVNLSNSTLMGDVVFSSNFDENFFPNGADTYRDTDADLDTNGWDGTDRMDVTLNNGSKWVGAAMSVHQVDSDGDGVYDSFAAGTDATATLIDIAANSLWPSSTYGIDNNDTAYGEDGHVVGNEVYQSGLFNVTLNGGSQWDTTKTSLIDTLSINSGSVVNVADSDLVSDSISLTGGAALNINEDGHVATDELTINNSTVTIADDVSAGWGVYDAALYANTINVTNNGVLDVGNSTAYALQADTLNLTSYTDANGNVNAGVFNVHSNSFVLDADLTNDRTNDITKSNYGYGVIAMNSDGHLTINGNGDAWTGDQSEVDNAGDNVAAATGNYKVRIDNATGEGSVADYKGKELIYVNDKNSKATFSAANKADQGAYTYQAQQEGNTVVMQQMELTDYANMALSIPSANTNIWNLEQDTVGTRLTNSRHGLADNGGAWVSYFGGSFDGDNGTINYDQDVNGIMVGVDTKIDGNNAKWIVGAAAGFAKGDMSDRTGQVDQDSQSAYIYSSARFANNVFVDGSLSYSHFNNDLSANMSNGQYVDGNTSADAWGFGLKLGYDWKLGDAGYVTPYGSVSGLFQSGDDYQLSNDMKVDGQSYDSMRYELGVDAGYTFTYSEDQALTPYFKLAYVYDDANNDADVNGDSIDNGVEGSAVRVGLGTQFSFTKNFSAYTDANYLGGGDVDQDWSANVGVKYTW
ncbi:TPA: autotransporter adhesin EhaB [Citrobacter koseri]|mgnify:FL=1|uniref:Autotransporter adhesin EhaB n=1 Tax=Citrobacter koseri TaxID=545 RepID=A0AAQ0VAZ3_CITKO|nr:MULTISPECIES: autotransporter adhesin EhaB [Citrobacter]OFV17382.1 autotransporter outer membrane beta-barrel domain-containing protein [Salmonella sp. HMSC13B08]ASE81512.1 autotransporter outer membrane beta-barrel domain-containing protein [Citrobacter koseri]ATF96371.1 autotransporter outer membrane beta-barrel domain-containing protein [Citrobacter koseri]AVE67568.1 autotransporter outer membrane beta-barrel domain-containing protein [Citrobacter koseri]EJK7981077.1 autotransporter adhe